MFRRIVRTTTIIALVAGAIGAAVVVSRKLMGGLGPEPGSADAPREWPSLVPDPPAPEASTASPSENGHTAPGSTPSTAAEI